MGSSFGTMRKKTKRYRATHDDLRKTVQASGRRTTSLHGEMLPNRETARRPLTSAVEREQPWWVKD